jgi:Transglycosylase SLT domain
LIDYALKGDWLDRVKRMTNDPVYGYSESRALRIFISTHTVAQFYEIPYPTFFCLLFQESQFDFKVRSKTGAAGLGQLTSIAIRQLQKNRKNMATEKQIQATITHLGNIYRDPIFKEYLTEMGFQSEFPNLKQFPKTIVPAGNVNSAFVKEIAKQLVKKGHSYGKNFSLVQKLTGQISRGVLLPKAYAALHPIYYETLSKAKNSLGYTLNIETNILLSAMLLRYYMDYSWKANGTRVRLRPEVNALVAVAAYNQGPGGVQRYLSGFKQNFPKKDLSKMSLADFRSTFTSTRVASALQQTPARAKEVFEHVWKVKLCSHDKIYRSKSR